MAIADRLNLTGSQSGRANGTVNKGRGAAGSGVDADGKPRLVQASVSKNATFSNLSRPFGVFMDDALTTELVEYYSVPGSFLLVQAGAAVAADKDVMIDADGKFIEATSTAGQYTQLWGRSLEAALALDDWFTIMFMPQVITVAAAAGADFAVAGKLDVVGDITAAGGFRRSIGPWVQENVAANQASVKLKRCVTDGVALKWVADRAGSLVGITGYLETAGAAGEDMLVKVFKNGALIDAAALLTFDFGTTSVTERITFAKDTAGLTFAAGDYLEVVVITGAGWTATTADLSVDLEVEL